MLLACTDHSVQPSARRALDAVKDKMKILNEQLETIEDWTGAR